MLSQLKVIELASVLAGPAVGLFFAELGAEVIKIENASTGGDVTRRWRLPNEDKERSYSAYYCNVNWGKTSLMLDLRQESDREKVYKFVKDADIVVSNFRLASAKKIGMDYDTLKNIQPQLIYAQLTGFGETENRAAFDVVLQAETGFLYMCGEANRPPVKMPVALIDLLAAHQLKEGILVALLQRMKTGKGAYVTTSLFEAAIASLANQATNWLMEGFIPQRMGSMHPNIAPYGDLFISKDNKAIIVAVGTERQFKGLCDCLDMPHLLEDIRFESNANRVQHREELKVLLAEAFKVWNALDILEKLHKVSVPVGSIRNMQEVFELPMAQNMILQEKMEDGQLSSRVKTVAFQIK